MSLQAYNVFLTGGAQGLGKSYVDALLSTGSKVFFIDVDVGSGNKTQNEFEEKYGPGVVKFQAADCTDRTQLEEAFASAVKFLGHISLMVNNAGLLDEKKIEEMIQLNFLAVVRGTNLAAEHMRRDKGGKGGRIINISSIVGLIDALVCPVYGATKQAVRSFTSSLALAPDIQQQGIEYGILCPSPAATNMFLNLENGKMIHLHTLPLDVRTNMTAPIESIQKGFIKLLSLEHMNGAVLYASKTEMTFRRVDNVDLGESWPVKLPEGN